MKNANWPIGVAALSVSQRTCTRPLIVCTRAETRTVQLALANLFTQPPIQWGDILACAVLVTLPVLLVFRLAQRHVVASDLGAGIKS